MDQMRLNEVTELDLIATTNILHHCEFIYILQIVTLAIFYHFQDTDGFNDTGNIQRLPFILLLSEHVFGFFTQIYRKHEIKQKGEFDINGVKRAKVETILKTVQVFFDCILVGFAVNFLIEYGWSFIQAAPFANYFLIFDLIMTITTLGYIYFSQIMIIQSEITKNIYTLSYMQFFLTKRKRAKLEWAKIFQLIT